MKAMMKAKAKAKARPKAKIKAKAESRRKIEGRRRERRRRREPDQFFSKYWLKKKVKRSDLQALSVFPETKI